MRSFEKISYRQFERDVRNNKELYDSYLLPKRSSKYSAGYDFYAVEDMVIKPGEIKKIATGYKVKCESDEVLLIVVRSSMGFKYNVRLCNQVGVVDSDYYNNESNEGHIWIALQNEGKEEYVVKKDSAYAQGIFMKYLTTGEEANNIRNGGIGSSDGRR